MPQNILNIVLTIILSYLVGSISFSLILSKLLFKDDVRNYGSKNAGATNMMRTYGWKLGLLTFIGDMSKGIIAVIIGNLLVGDIGGYIAGLFCIIGHMYPIFYKFKGGKGVSAGAGIALMINPYIFLVMIAVFLACVLITKYVSLGSCIAAGLFPALTIIFSINNLNIVVATCSIIIGALIIWKHRANIQRLINKTESKISFKK